MAQIFKPAADTWLRVFAIAVALGVCGGFASASGYVRSDYSTRVSWVVDQRVPFSHRHHVGELHIDCRFCHTSVEVSPEAGYPATDTCMTCHSQIWTAASMLEPVRESLATGTPLRWQRVAFLPDYVYFRHDIHLHAGVGCSSCHGRIDRMPLTMRAETFQMRWCLDCHRNPAQQLRPHDRITDMTWTRESDPKIAAQRLANLHLASHDLTDCTTCHR